MVGQELDGWGAVRILHHLGAASGRGGGFQGVVRAVVVGQELDCWGTVRILYHLGWAGEGVKGVARAVVAARAEPRGTWHV